MLSWTGYILIDKIYQIISFYVSQLFKYIHKLFLYTKPLPINTTKRILRYFVFVHKILMRILGFDSFSRVVWEMLVLIKNYVHPIELLSRNAWDS